MRIVVGLIVGLMLGVAVPAVAATEKQDEWKPDYTCWYADDHKVNCRLDLNTKDDSLIRFREVTYVDGEWWSTETFWPQNARR